MKRLMLLVVVVMCGMCSASFAGWQSDLARQTGKMPSGGSNGTPIGQCMSDCGSEQGICIASCQGNVQCISRCSEAHGRCVARCK